MQTADNERSADHWLEQAELALAYAKARPACDSKGFFSALRDRENFLAKAAVLSKVGA